VTALADRQTQAAPPSGGKGLKGGRVRADGVRGGRLPAAQQGDAGLRHHVHLGTKTFGPVAGWMGGWGIIAADIIVMANLAQIAGQYMFQLFGAYGVASSKWWTLLAGVAWIVVMALICYLGIEISARVQYGLLAIELTMLLVFSFTALGKVYGGSAGHQAVKPAASWFNPFHMSYSGFSLGMLTALFIYWGWGHRGGGERGDQ
jgi:amino acid transporter